ncbi:hepatitis A virus cellular receptor 1 homolog isoform X1 [Anguilla anguilla]|uniref:hepatitis A virus cellular receptor 1 homolog isoform X1 n=1 Tax=Anguilla anguilla TaxID=7936 RepID=UPI0015AF2551|nr:hepatitis A virus cellular receptor 1 homolog isoform X1 [Anguilla anguilla]
MRRLCAVFYCTTLSVLSVCVGSMLTLIGKTGESVTLPCRYDIIANGLTEMCWGRGEVPTSKCSNTIVSTDGEKVTFSESDRYRLQSGVQEGNVSLTIINVTENDSGIYGCRVEISGWFNDLKLNFYLITVKGVPESNTPLNTTELPVFYSDAQRGEGTTPPADTGNSDIPVLVSVQDQEISQRFSGNVIRIGAAIFIPGLIIIVILELRSRQEKRRRSAEQLDHSAPTVQIRN